MLIEYSKLIDYSNEVKLFRLYLTCLVKIIFTLITCHIVDCSTNLLLARRFSLVSLLPGTYRDLSNRHLYATFCFLWFGKIVRKFMLCFHFQIKTRSTQNLTFESLGRKMIFFLIFKTNLVCF